jgi:FkbM family methyltransferase
MNTAAIGEQFRQALRGRVSKNLYHRAAAFLDSWYGIQRFGIKDYRQLDAIGKAPRGEAPAAMRLRNLPHPFYIRPGTPDVGVVLHAMAREAYSYKLPSGAVHLVIDAGANIGDTSVWYATRFPDALVVAIEPNPDSLEILSRNCESYGDRIRLLRAALWPVADRNLAVTGAMTGAQVHEASDAGDLLCPSVDPLTILRDSGRDVIDIFKIDIEGAELALFTGDCDSWLKKTRTIAIEIHTPEALEAVLSATKRNGFKSAIYRDLYFFWK